MDNTYPTEEKAPSPVSTIVIFFVVAAVFGVSMLARQGKHISAAAAGEVLPTSAMISMFPSATPWPSSTPSPTATALPTSQPTSTRQAPTAAPSVVPSPTADLAWVATKNALDVEYQQRIADIREQEKNTFWDGAWNLGKFFAFVVVVIGASCILIWAYTRKPKPVQNDAQTHTPATQQNLPEFRLIQTGETKAGILGFCKRLDELGGVYATDMENKFYPSPMPTQADLRRLVRKMKSLDLLTEIDGGFEMSVDCWNMLNRLSGLSPTE